MLRSGLRTVRRSAALLPLGAIAAASSHDLLILIGLAALLVLVVLVVVVTPAIWSRKRYRRAAALAVLDRIFRRDIRGLGDAEGTKSLRVRR